MTYIFTNANSIRIKSMNEIIDQHQVNHSIHVSCEPKILVIISSKSYLQKEQEDDIVSANSIVKFQVETKYFKSINIWKYIKLLWVFMGRSIHILKGTNSHHRKLFLLNMWYVPIKLDIISKA